MRKVELHLKFFMCVTQSRQLVRTPQRTGTIEGGWVCKGQGRPGVVGRKEGRGACGTLK